MNRIIRIGTRDSELALWQANHVKNKLAKLGQEAVLAPIKSQGDLVLDKPLYELGITGIFTKTLDVAMLKGDIDIAVHSLKDVPTLLPKGIVQAAVLKRANVHDILVHKGLDFLSDEGTVATGSLRRKAQWLHKYPKHKLVDLRGNVNTRLQKLVDNPWNGAIFAKAGLERINLLPKEMVLLDWMLPAPAQGAMMIAAMETDTYCKQVLTALNDDETELCTTIERDFLRTLEGGCTAPIAALATITHHTIKFEGALFSLDGKKKVTIKKDVPINNAHGFGKICAREVLAKGGKELMFTIKKEMQ
ncbi:hydroxymethylbilane synthase [Spongiimicrobium sp. 3-5]|uniref:hydroxymethylbilane synthase n=1 Tax=Spongiimicrobium sp. 3-5 TaxID=3332596 RepID=UPI00398083A4